MHQARSNGRRLDRIKPDTRVKNTSFQPGNISGKWFEDGHSSVRADSIDRHILTRADETAIIWETGDPKTPAKLITYRELLEQTCRLARVPKAHGVTKGDRLVLYMPMIPVAAYAMLACNRIGAIQSIGFGDVVWCRADKGPVTGQSRNIAAPTRFLIARESHDHDRATLRAEALPRIRANDPDLVLPHVMLPPPRLGAGVVQGYRTGCRGFFT